MGIIQADHNNLVVTSILLYKSRTPVLTQVYTGQVRVLTSGVVFAVGIPDTGTPAIY